MEIGTLILGIIVLLLLLGCVPILLGALIAPCIHRENAESVTFMYVSGVLIMLCVMQLFSVPMTLLKMRFSELVLGYNIILVLLCAAALIFRRKKLTCVIKSSLERIRKADKIWIIVVIAIYIPIIFLSCHTTYIYGDDKTYLTMVNDIVSTDSLYMVDIFTGEAQTWVSAKYSLSSYWTFLAYLAKMTGIHPLILCKTLLMYIIIPMYYAVQGLLAAYFFRNREREMAVYMLIVNLVSIFGGFSIFTITYRLTTWVWQSKAFLALIALPFLFYYANLIFEKRTMLREYLLLWVFIMATCSTTLTGTGLAVAMVMALALIYAVRRRKIGMVFGAAFASSPALLFMYMYLKNDILVSYINTIFQ